MHNALTSGLLVALLAVVDSLPAQSGARFAANGPERPKLDPGLKLEPWRRP